MNREDSSIIVPRELESAIELLDAAVFLSRPDGIVVKKNSNAAAMFVSPRVGSSIQPHLRRQIEGFADIFADGELRPSVSIVGNAQISFPGLSLAFDYEGTRYIVSIYFNSIYHINISGQIRFWGSLVELSPCIAAIIERNCLAVKNDARLASIKRKATFAVARQTAKMLGLLENYNEKKINVNALLRLFEVYFGSLREIRLNVEFVLTTFAVNAVSMVEYKEFIACVTVFCSALFPYVSVKAEVKATVFYLSIENGNLVFDGYFERSEAEEYDYKGSILVLAAQRLAEFLGYRIEIKDSGASTTTRVKITVPAEMIDISARSLRSADFLISDAESELMRRLEKMII